MSPEQKQQISDQYVQYQMNRGGSLKPTFAHVDEETAWKLAHPATLDACPECNDVMMDQGDKVSCHSCGHTQPIIRTQAAVLAPLGEAAIGGLAEMGGGAAAGGAAEGAGGLAGGGGGISGIGNLMNSALGRGNPLQNAYYTDKLLGGGQQAGGGAAAAPEQMMEDPSAMQGVISKVQIQKEAGVWGAIIENLVNMLQKTPEAFADPKNPLSYADDVAGLAAGAGGATQQGSQYMSSIEVHAGEKWDYFKDQLGDAAGAAGQVGADIVNNFGGAAAQMRDGLRDTLGLWETCPQCAEAKLKPMGGGHYERCSNCGYDPAPIDRPTHAIGDDGNYTYGEQYHEYGHDPEHGRKQMFGSVFHAIGAGGPGDDNVGMATDNRGENSDPEHDGSGASFKEKGDSPELLKDVDGPGDAKGDAFPQDDLKNQGDPALQEKALKSLHMNLPLVIEFSKSPEPGSENPILQALDAILEEAFPGYKDGTDGESEQKEHPADEAKSEDESGEKPDDGDSSNGEEKPEEKSDPKEASVWHYAFDLPGVERDPATPNGWTSDGGKDRGYVPELDGPADPYVCPNCGFSTHDNIYNCPECGEELVDHDPRGYEPDQDEYTGPGHYELYGPDQPTWKDMFPHEAAGLPMAPGQVPVGADNGVATLPPAAPTAAPVCPICGQTHAPGTACPVPAANNVQQPTATGAPITPPQPNAVVTKWHIVTVDEQVEDEDEDDKDKDDGKVVDLHDKKDYGPNDTHNIKASFDDEFGFFTASDEPHHEHEVEHKKDEDDSIADDGSSDDIDSSSDTPWVDDSGAPLQEGMDYELKANSYAIPDRVTVDRILPDKIQYTLHGGDVDYQDEVTKEQLDLDGISFTPVGGGDTYDSEDDFQDWNAEAPVRPGQDATPQQDDLSTPTTVVSHEEFAPISLETYTGSFRGDAPDDRSWLMGESSEVAVDPSLMAKFAAKDFSAREQRAFIDESGEARNLDLLKLEGTHYVMDDVDAHFNW